VKHAVVIFLVLLLLCCSYSIAKKVTNLPQITTPITIDISNSEIYVLDEATVYIYSLKDFHLIRKFGEKGEGKGQLTPNTEVPIAMNIVDGNVFLNSQVKLIKFSKDGKLLREQRLPFSFQTVPYGKDFASIKITVGPRVQRFSVVHYDDRFQQKKVLYSRERIPRSRRGQLPMPPELIIIRSTGDRLYVFDQKKDFVIDVYGSDGEEEKTIKMDYKKIKVTDNFKKVAEAWFRAQPSFRMAAEELREMIYFPDYLPVVRNFIIKNNKIYIQTYKNQNNLSEFLILDMEGKLIKQVMLPGFHDFPLQFNSSRIFTFYNNSYYYLMQNETGWELHVEEMK